MGAGMVIRVVDMVVVATTLGEVADVNLTKPAVVMESTTIGSLRNNLIVWMRKDTNVSFGIILLAAKFKPIIRTLFPLIPLLHLLPLLLPSKPLYPRYRYLVPQLYQSHNLFSLVYHHLLPHRHHSLSPWQLLLHARVPIYPPL